MANRQSSPRSTAEGKMPIFIYPPQLTFYSDDQSSHKQVLTLYNPYDFALKFKILCTNPSKYSVVDSDGVVKSRCCVDIVVRHKDICISNEGIRDKFRIHAYEYGQRIILGKRDITCVLFPTKERVSAEDVFENIPSNAVSTQPQVGQRNFSAEAMAAAGVAQHASGPSWFLIATSLIALIAVFLPDVGSPSSLPEYLHIPHGYKLMACYILGLMTAMIIK